MIIVCERCSRQGLLEEELYRGKTLRLKCPYCSQAFVHTVSLNGSNSSNIIEESAPDPQMAAGSLPESPAMVAETAVAQEESVDAIVLEAKRIARLIISEIKLYNQEKIEIAKSKKEVLEILKNDLIKGKQHYNSRVASRLPAGPDYFTETVKEILLAGKS